MKMRKFALLLALVMSLTAILPVTAWAAQEDPLVLESKKTSADEYRYAYDPDGNCLMEEWHYGDIWETTYWNYYENGMPLEKAVYRNGNLLETVSYDACGNMTQRWEYENGKSKMWNSVPEYDDYGRLSWITVTGPYDEKKNLAEDYKVQKTRYEYYDDPVTLTFGRFEQDGNTANGPEPIEWEVLDTDGENILLISKYALDSRVYHSKRTDVSWEDSDLRSWLNGEFLEKAFSYSEYCQLRPVKLDPNHLNWVYLLSTAEVLYYFPNEEDRICEATPYAVRQNAYVNNTTKGSWWLLRTPGTTKQQVASVNSDGAMDYDGGSVAAKRGTVRPVMWVCKSAMAGNAIPSRKHEWLEAYEDGETTPKYTSSSLLTYNEDGILIYKQAESSYAGAWSTSVRASYDDYGNLTDSMVSTRKFSNNKENDSDDLQIDTYENTYDKTGRLTKRVWFWDNQPKDMEQYRYNKQGKAISRTRSMYTEKGWEVYETDTWTYDRYGNLLTYCVDGFVEEEYTYTPLSQAQWS